MGRFQITAASVASSAQRSPQALPGRGFKGLKVRGGGPWTAMPAVPVPVLVLLAPLFVPMVACAPALDWREVRPDQAHVQALFPCRPGTQSRTVKLAAQSVTLHLHACSAGGQTWALAHADLGDPTLLTAALDELVASAASNLGASADAGQPLQVPGATPHAGARKVRIAGRLPDGKAVQEQVAVFTRGTAVYQATALGAALPEDAAQIFVNSLRVLP